MVPGVGGRHESDLTGLWPSGRIVRPTFTELGMTRNQRQGEGVASRVL